MLVERVCVGVTELVQQLRRALDVREQERHYAGREQRRHESIITLPKAAVQLLERNALDPAVLHARCLEREIEPSELRVSGEPPARSHPHAANLLLVDHLERVPERRASLLLHLDEQHSPAATEDEVELVASDARVRVEQAVAAKPVVAEGAALARVQAASVAGDS